MTMAPQDYAELAEHSYDRKGDMQDLVNKHVVLEGVTYKVLEYVNNPHNGYQGTIYQRMDSSEVIVAHRGTEFEREPWNDLIKTDGAMVVARANIQAVDAIALTSRAEEIAKEQAERRGFVPEVTVTGHSLGGTLAQITAHHFDLRGETFNAYGAASLTYRIPEGGNRVLNHVTAADMVSSASPHYGQVRVYAMPQEIAMLRDRGYANDDTRLFDVRNKLGAAIAGLGSHDMHYFRNTDGDGNVDRSVLGDARTRGLARDYGPMIAKYREDVEGIRRDAAVGLRGPAGLVLDGIDRLRGPLPAGEPAAREAREQQRRELRPAVSETQPLSQRHREPYGDADVISRFTDVDTAGPTVRPPMRLQVDAAPSRAPPGPLRPQSADEARSAIVAQLLQAAPHDDPDAMKSAMQALQQSASGQAWQQQAADHRRELDQASPAPDVLQAQQRQAQIEGMAR